jgi:hypothetical protein
MKKWDRMVKIGNLEIEGSGDESGNGSMSPVQRRMG